MKFCRRHAIFATLLFTVSTPALAMQATEAEPSTPATEVEEAEAARAKKEKEKSAWQIKPRWRVQYDVAKIDGPVGLTGTDTFDDIRRAQLGIDIKMPHGFSARVEGEFTADPIEFTDLYLAWDQKGINVTAGQQKALTPLDEMTSDLHTSFLERAAFITAFNYGRRTGLSAGYAKGDWAINGGVFTDPLIMLDDVKSNSISADFRGFWSPQLGKVKLHLGAAYHWRDLKDFEGVATRYRQRPAVRITDTRYIGTPGLLVDKEQRYGLEAAAVSGRFHGAAEVHWLDASRPGLSDPKFFGGYGEVGFFLTNDSRPLKGGTFGAIKPKKPLGSGGIGAVQINVRYDYLDLNSSGVTGGKQNGYLASLIWVPVNFLKLIVNYARLDYSDAAISVGGDRNYSVDVIGARVQLSY